MFNVDISNKHFSVKQKKIFFLNGSHTGFGLLLGSLEPLLACSCRCAPSLAAFFIFLACVRLFSLCGCAALQPAHHHLAAFCGFGPLETTVDRNKLLCLLAANVCDHIWKETWWIWYLFALQSNRLQAFWGVVARVVNQRRDRMKSQSIFGLQELNGITKFHLPKVEPFSHFLLSLQNCWHPKEQPQRSVQNGPTYISSLISYFFFSFFLPMMDALQVRWSIYSNHTVRVQRFSSTRGFPAVK